MKLKTLLAAIVLLAPTLAMAGGTATIVTTSKASQYGSIKVPKSSDTMRIDWRDVHTLRMQIGNQKSYMLFRDGKGYSVSQEDGHTMVMDMAGMARMGQAMAGKSNHSSRNMFASVDSIKATGKTATVAGIKGHVYRMTSTDANGHEQTTDAVLTSDPLVTEFTRAYLGATSAMFGASKRSQDFWTRLPSGERGLLKSGEGFQLEAINDTTPPASHYKLPAKPMDLRQMFKGMNQH